MHFFMWAAAFLFSSLFIGVKPSDGKVQTQAEGRISLSAKLMYCCTKAASKALDPLRASLETKEKKYNEKKSKEQHHTLLCGNNYWPE